MGWMEDEEEKTDLCLAMGTSLCGMNADRMAETPAEKALEGEASGTVIVALQQTQMDKIASLRIFATIDEVMALLAKELDLDVDMEPYQSPRGPTPDTRNQVHWGRQCSVTGVMPITGTCY